MPWSSPSASRHRVEFDGFWQETHSSQAKPNDLESGYLFQHSTLPSKRISEALLADSNILWLGQTPTSLTLPDALQIEHCFPSVRASERVKRMSSAEALGKTWKIPTPARLPLFFVRSPDPRSRFSIRRKGDINPNCETPTNQ